MQRTAHNKTTTVAAAGAQGDGGGGAGEVGGGGGGKGAEANLNPECFNQKSQRQRCTQGTKPKTVIQEHPAVHTELTNT